MLCVFPDYAEEFSPCQQSALNFCRWRIRCFGYMDKDRRSFGVDTVSLGNMNLNSTRQITERISFLRDRQGVSNPFWMCDQIYNEITWRTWRRVSLHELFHAFTIDVRVATASYAALNIKKHLPR